MNGILIIDKPSGITSHDVVQKVRKILQLRKAGHTGTLDPLATGVLILCVGRATKLVRFLQAEDKEYVAEMRLGLVTDTYDSTGEVVEEKQCHFSEDEIARTLLEFKGTITQIPPITSAVKVSGVPMYKLARQGKEVEPRSRKVEIAEIELLGTRNGDSTLNTSAQVVTFRVVCSKGTYIRALCFDVGQALGCGATMNSLTRIRSGIFHLDQAVAMGELAKYGSGGKSEEFLFSMNDALSNYSAAVIEKGAIFHVTNGVFLRSKMVKKIEGELKKGDIVRLRDEDSNLLAVAVATCDLAPGETSGEVIAKPLCVFPDLR